MEGIMFEKHVSQCKSVHESTGYAEIFSYTDQNYNSSVCGDKQPLAAREFSDFLDRQGRFAPAKLPEGVKLVSGIRLLLQLNAHNSDTFAPNVISLSRSEYTSMVRKWHLPTRAVEATSVVGPFFWYGHNRDSDDPRFQMMFRKSDVKKKGMTRGWELLLSYSIREGMTLGFLKGTPSSDVAEVVRHVQSCTAEIGHPLLVPIITLSYQLSPRQEERQREARSWVRRLENALSMRSEIDDPYFNNSALDIDMISRDLAECQCQILWMQPAAWQKILLRFQEAMAAFWAACADQKKDKPLERSHSMMQDRLRFYQDKLDGTQYYIDATLARLEIQRNSLFTVLSQKNGEVNLEVASQQRRLAHYSMRDSSSMKTLSLLGAAFLPGTFLAAIFSMTFFNFQSLRVRLLSRPRLCRLTSAMDLLCGHDTLHYCRSRRLDYLGSEANSTGRARKPGSRAKSGGPDGIDEAGENGARWGISLAASCFMIPSSQFIQTQISLPG
ncbi:hypothetical protein B0H67DRAFT_582215 [Lasiosphaeris hirsuta]|uniref:Uncharacterized protein n=1 Tax=Lasiosphaeris hirsuta TaxID=260670 RepID=A0AA40AHM5_9PEZI|nr:hypothetical protein B0H67DRAFT_582215 [Lasiosphaeris hirsuta]